MNSAILAWMKINYYFGENWLAKSCVGSNFFVYSPTVGEWIKLKFMTNVVGFNIQTLRPWGSKKISVRDKY